MTVCPNCGNDKLSPVSDWLVSDAKTANSQGKGSVFILLFECPKCKARFTTRTLVKPNATVSSTAPESHVSTANVKNVVDRMNQVRELLMQTMKELKEKIKLLEEERARLSGEVESLRKAAEARVAVLESEVGELKGEAKALRELLGGGPEPVSAPVHTPSVQILPNRK